MEELSYGSSMGHVANWGKFEAFRELWANAHDTGEEFEIHLEGDTLIFQDRGEGIAVTNLLIGEHQGVQGVNSIGQFGEGLKLAMLVCVREGMPMKIETGHYVFVPGKKKFRDIDILKVDVCGPEDGTQYHHGTKITIESWGDHLFEDRFIKDYDSDSKVIFTVEGGSVLWPKALFNKGVYVQSLVDYAFGYDVNAITMNRDRASAESREIHSAVGRIWGKIDWAGAWEQLFASFKNKKAEASMEIWQYDYQILPAVKEGFESAFGADCCMQTSEEDSRECVHRGARVIPPTLMGFSLESLVKSAGIPSDKEWLKKHGVKAYKKVSDKELTPDQKKVMTLLRSMGRKTFCGYGVEAADLPNDVLGECDREESKIRISRIVLNAEDTAKRVMIHELAHALYGHADMTESFVADCCRVGVMLMK